MKIAYFLMGIGAGVLAAIFLWRLTLYCMWTLEKLFFSRGVRDFIDLKPRGRKEKCAG